jgi:O-succinylbenzoate synthase
MRPASLRSACEAAKSINDWPVLHPRIAINALVTGDKGMMLAAARAAAERGCRCLKLKTGGVPIVKLPSFLRQVAEASGYGCLLRIDPNRSWTLNQTMELADALQGLPIAYFEEPLDDASSLPELIRSCPVPIALDETLREITPEDLGRFKGAAALVLKPTLIGGFDLCRRFAVAGQSLGMDAVVSASYESGVGIYTLGRFAASLPNQAAAGLDTYSMLKEDVLCQRLALEEFTFRADQPMPDVDESRLLPL